MRTPKIGRFIIAMAALVSFCPSLHAQESHVTVVNDVLCKGCGTCAAACPSAAITARHFTDVQIFAEIEGALYDVRA